MNTAEEMISAAVGRDEFWQACQACFSGQSGAVVLRALAAISHPLTPPVGGDALDTYRLIGRAEIVSLLLRFSEAQVTPAQLAKYHASETERNTTASGGDPKCWRSPDGERKSNHPDCSGCDVPGCPAYREP